MKLINFATLFLMSLITLFSELFFYHNFDFFTDFFLWFKNFIFDYFFKSNYINLL